MVVVQSGEEQRDNATLLLQKASELAKSILVELEATLKDKGTKRKAETDDTT